MRKLLAFGRFCREKSDREMSTVAAILLAAGESRRMGRPKQLLPWRGRTLLEHSIETARGSRCSPVLVVLGAYRAALHPLIASAGVFRVINPDWAEGLGSSIRTAILTLDSLAVRPEAVVLLLADQPLVTPAIIDRLVEVHETNRHSIIVSEYAGSTGLPALFASERFPELAQLEGQAGVEDVIGRHPQTLMRTPFPEGAVDVDTHEDYARSLRAYGRA